ncbi:hypothetical protein ACP70R_019984 [Stipagrostis hirtigluma subsp. patula]
MAEASTAPAAFLPDDLIVEILSRLPARSLCRFKCVSRSWRALISDPTNGARLAQTLSGFFFFFSSGGPDDTHPHYGFAALSSPPPPIDQSLSFLPPSCQDIELMDSCNGLFLLRCSSERPWPLCSGGWVVLPQPKNAPGECRGGYKNTRFAALGFDPAVSSHFHVFQLIEEEDTYNLYVEAVEIYSSETGKWVLHESGWDKSRWIFFGGSMTYLNGFLHFAVHDNAVASVDTKGQAWRVTIVRCPPEDDDDYHSNGFIGHSQGRLLYVHDGVQDDFMSIYVQEGHNSEEWTFKQSVSKLDLFGPQESQRGPGYSVAAFHPDGDLIFFDDQSRKILMSYDMNYEDVHVICTVRETCHTLLPYVPLYTGAALALPNAD